MFFDKCNTIKNVIKEYKLKLMQRKSSVSFKTLHLYCKIHSAHPWTVIGKIQQLDQAHSTSPVLVLIL